jgi:hypothetical protein
MEDNNPPVLIQAGSPSDGTPQWRLPVHTSALIAVVVGVALALYGILVLFKSTQ